MTPRRLPPWLIARLCIVDATAGVGWILLGTGVVPYTLAAIHGWHRDVWPTLVAAGMTAIGIAVIAATAIRGLGVVSTLRFGQVTTGALVQTRPANWLRNNRAVFALTYAYAPDRTWTIETPRPDTFTTAEPIIYDTTRAIVLRTLPCRAVELLRAE